jgi:tetraacyldisaccharide 4'-kinase
MLRPRPWLAPLSPLYWLATRLHRGWMRAAGFLDRHSGPLARRRSPPPPGGEPPLVVIGALRAGGSGKTSVTLELARRFTARGLKVAVLAYRLGSFRAGVADRGANVSDRDLFEVRPDGDWRESSDEALLLSRESGARVFATRRRARARRALAALGRSEGRPFDLILCDDGFQDARLGAGASAVRDGILRILLIAQGERPGLWDLLPAGPFRETWRSAARADLVIAEAPPDAAPAAEPTRFRCRAAIPAGLDRARPWIAVSGLGDNHRFAEDLRREGLAPIEAIEAGDHRLPGWDRLRDCARRHSGAGFLCTAKDAVKTDPGRWREEGLPEPVIVGREVDLPPRLLEAIEAHRTRGR